ncbi:MAG: carbohydrate ABC transporter permease [Bacilli bacterium]|nr:carbohydrate ABC transporter permease [Bacilli bacterium]
MAKQEEYKFAADTSDYVLALSGSEASTAQKEKLSKVAHIVSLVFIYLFLVAMGIIIIFPFYWMIITSLKEGKEIQQMQQTFFPQVIRWENYTEAFKRLDFGTLLRNTLLVGILSTLGTLFTTIFAAYAFARLNFKGRNLVFAFLLGSMMIPGEMMVISNYISVSRLGWTSSSNTVGNFAAMIVPFWVSIFYIYLLRQNFKQIPNELYLAAKVDGKSDWEFLWKVMVPLAMPTLTTIFILKLMGAWNSYVWPNLIASGNRNIFLITNGLRETFSTADNPNDYGAQMAATVVVTVPLLLLFIFFRKYIMRGVGRAGIKG